MNFNFQNQFWKSPAIYHSPAPTCLWRWNRQSFPKLRYIKFRGRGITHKKADIIQNTAKVWNQEYLFSFLKHIKRTQCKFTVRNAVTFWHTPWNKISIEKLIVIQQTQHHNSPSTDCTPKQEIQHILTNYNLLNIYFYFTLTHISQAVHFLQSFGLQFCIYFLFPYACYIYHIRVFYLTNM